MRFSSRMRRIGIMAGTLALLPVATARGQEVTDVDRGWAILGGVATGEGSWDAGFAVAAPYRLPLGSRALSLRVEPWIARYGGPGDGSLLILGGALMPRYLFTGSGSRTLPYVFAGPGAYYRNFSYSVAQTGTADIDSSDGKLGFTLGGGVEVGRLLGEVRLTDIDGFLTFPILIGFRF